MVTVSTYFEVFQWDLDTMILGSHILPWQKWGRKSPRGLFGVVELLVKGFLKKQTNKQKKRSFLPHTLMYFPGFGHIRFYDRVTNVPLTGVGSEITYRSYGDTKLLVKGFKNGYWLHITLSIYFDVLQWDLRQMILM